MLQRYIENNQIHLCLNIFLSVLFYYYFFFTFERVHRYGLGGSVRACHAAGSGTIPGRDKFPG